MVCVWFGRGCHHVVWVNSMGLVTLGDWTIIIISRGRSVPYIIVIVGKLFLKQRYRIMCLLHSTKGHRLLLSIRLWLPPELILLFISLTGQIFAILALWVFQHKRVGTFVLCKYFLLLNFQYVRWLWIYGNWLKSLHLLRFNFLSYFCAVWLIVWILVAIDFSWKQMTLIERKVVVNALQMDLIWT